MVSPLTFFSVFDKLLMQKSLDCAVKAYSLTH